MSYKLSTLGGAFAISNGNVGIGATVPLAKLDVNGDIKLTGTGNIVNSSGRAIVKQTGSVLNVVNAKTDLLYTSGSQNLISVSITPTSSSSKFLVLCSVCCERNGGSVSTYVYTHLYRDNTAVVGSFGNALGHQVSQNARQSGSTSYLDSPATTSAITYRAYVDHATAGGVQFIWYATTITVMEIAG